ncbi:MAG: hypothetical protein IJP59_12125 [Muribaculaceae bacterium]|nr:hypothetical protein [Muribaculaceae bacterium]
MKKFLFIILSCFTFALTSNAQAPNLATDYEFNTAYDSNGNEVEIPGHPSKIHILVVTSNFLGYVQSSCSYAEYNPITGLMNGHITFSYAGMNNGWYVYVWNNNYVLIGSSLDTVRVQMNFYRGCYCEYTR